MQRRGGQQQVDGAVGEHFRRVLVADGQRGRVRLPGHLGQDGRWQLDGLVRVAELQRDRLAVRAGGAVHEHGRLLRHRIATLQRHPDAGQALRETKKNDPVWCGTQLNSKFLRRNYLARAK